MSQLIKKDSAAIGTIKNIVTNVGPDVKPDALGNIAVGGGANITTDGTLPNTVEIRVSGTTDHAVQVGNATNSLTSLAVGSHGQVLLGATADDPAFGTLTSTNNTILYTPAANALDLVVGNDVLRNVLTDDTNTASPAFGILELAGGVGIETSSAAIPADKVTVAVNDSLQITTGFESWGGAGAYFDDTVLGDFTLLRPGTGFINTVPVSWAAPQTVTGMTAGSAYFIYVDATGTLGLTDTFTVALYQDNIVLFQCLRDTTLVNNQITVKENHPFEMPVETSYYLHNVVGTVIENVNNGANITLNGTQKIQINGDDVFSDHGLETDIPDSAGVAVSFRQMYTDAGGKWATDSVSDTFTGRYNAAGTPTALSANRLAVYRLYASKDSLNVTTPSYFAVLHTAQFVTIGAANTAIGNGSIAMATNELAHLEVAQLGYIVYSEASASIVSVIIEKATLKQTTSTAGTNTASLVNTNVTNFDGILSAADTNVQAALDTLDEFGKNLTDKALVVGNGNGQPLGVIAVGATGETLMGNTANDPVWTGSPSFSGTATAGTGFTATTGNVKVTTGDVDITTGNLHFETIAPNTTQGSIFYGASSTPFLHRTGTGISNIWLGEGTGNATTSSVGNVALGLECSDKLTSGGYNVAIGYQTLNHVTTHSHNVAIGRAAGNYCLGSNNVLLGKEAGFETLGDDNTAVGYFAMGSTITGSSNTAIGAGALAVGTHSFNTCIGYASGSLTENNESSNILIRNAGVAWESNAIRIGTTGSGNGQQNATYIAGIYGVTPAGTKNMAIVDSNGQFGSAPLPLSWAAVTADATLVINTGTVANKAGLLTMTLPATAAIGDIIEITGINTAVGWRIAQNANQQIFFGTSSTTVGVTGYLEATAIRDSVKLLCVVAGTSTVYNVLSSVGNITVA